MQLSKKEYKILYYIGRGKTDLEVFHKSEINSVLIFLKKFEKLKIVKVQIRENEIYGFILTDEGEKILNDKKYEKWFLELGD